MKKITMKQLIDNSNIPAKLIRSTITQFGGWDSFRECAQDVTNHGIDGGFHGFIYYVDTTKFFRKNRNMIMELATEQATGFGDRGALEMIRNFNCLIDKRTRKPDFSADEIARAIYQSKGDCVDIIQNALAWYAGEEVARAYCDLLDQE